MIIKNLAITGMSHDGKGAGRLPGRGQGKTVFVSGALPGQVADCEIIAEKKNCAFGRAVEIRQGLTALKAACPHQAVCGGCPLQLMPIEDQLCWKRKIALEAMARIGGYDRAELEALFEKPLASPRLEGFRNKFEFAFGQDKNGKLKLGFRLLNSHEVFNLEKCALDPGGAVEIAKLFRSLAARFKLPAYDGKNGFWRALVVRSGLDLSGSGKKWRVICLTSPCGEKEAAAVLEIGREILNQREDAAAFVHETRSASDWQNKGQKRIACLDENGRLNPEAAVMALPLGGKLFRLDIASFFQINSEASELLAKLAMEMNFQSDQDGQLLDLYCGVGAPGLFLAPRYSAVTGVEFDKAAARLAEINARSAFKVPQARYLAGDAARLARKALACEKKGAFAAVLLDPPRDGASKNALEAIKKARVRRVICISCNPATFARDAAELRGKYRLRRLASVDLFPHSAHLECAGLWELAD